MYGLSFILEKEVVKMKEFLFCVNLICRVTGEKISIFVWGLNTDDATHKVTSVLCGYNGEYIWAGSGPEYRDNHLVSRPYITV